jgi:hypothetical protein
MAGDQDVDAVCETVRPPNLFRDGRSERNGFAWIIGDRHFGNALYSNLITAERVGVDLA